MKAPSINYQRSAPQARSHDLDWLRGLARRVVVSFQTARRARPDREPTVESIVDRIMVLDCDEWCEVQLNPRRTRIANLKWLLPICVQQFGTTISMREHTEGDRVVLTITATASSRKTVSRPAGRGGQVEVAAGELVVAA